MKYRAQSGNAMLQQLRGLGMKIRRQDFQGIRREVLGFERFEERVRATPRTRRVAKAFINKEPPWKMKQKYLYRFEVLGAHPDTGDGLTMFFSIYSDSELTVEAAEGKMFASLIAAPEFYRIVIEQANLRQVIRR